MFKFEKYCDVMTSKFETEMQIEPKYVIWFPYKGWISIPCKDKMEVKYHLNNIPSEIHFVIFPVKDYRMFNLYDLDNYKE